MNIPIIKKFLTNKIDIVRFLGLVILCLSFCGKANAQVTIQFVSSENYQPIEKVALFTLDKSFSTVSNAEGKCTIDFDLKDEDMLTVQHLSFLEESISFKNLKSQKQFVLIPKSIELDELVIGVSKSEERREEISNKIDLIKASDLQLSNPQTSADLLTQTGSVYIQKSQMGGGSPVIRGFEANKVLIAVDGVKLNNAIYRGGHLQNVITIDPGIIDRTEVVYGPGSLVYGSDAIGGVMHFVTKNPAFSKDGKFNFSGNAMLRSASANKEKTAHIDISLASSNWASLSSISFSDFGDLTIGKKRNEEEGTWGQLPYSVSNENGYDENIDNSNPDILLGTAYNQLDILQKIIFKYNEQHRFTLNAQYSTSSEIPRFDKLNDLIEGDIDTRPIPKWAKWSYGPQNRLLASLQHRFASNDYVAFNNLTTTVAYQKIEEDRIKRKFAGSQTVHNEEDVHVFSLNSDAQKSINEKNELQYGLEFTHNEVRSDAYSTEEGLRLDPYVLTRYPDEGSNMTSASFYVRHKFKPGEKLTFSNGTV